MRELANLIERLAILFPFGVVDMGDLPEQFQIDGGSMPETKLCEELVMSLPPMTSEEPRLPREGVDLKEHLSNLEMSSIKQALEGGLWPTRPNGWARVAPS